MTTFTIPLEFYFWKCHYKRKALSKPIVTVMNTHIPVKESDNA